MLVKHRLMQLKFLVCLCFCLKIWVAHQCLIYSIHTIRFIFFYCVKEQHKSIQICVKIVLVWIVKNKCYWEVVKNILLSLFTCFLDTLENLILLCKTLMIFKVINEVPFAMLTQKIEFYMGWVRRPLKIK